MDRRLWFGGLLVGSGIVGRHALVGVLDLGAKNDQYTYLLLIIPIIAAFIVREWKTVEQLARSGTASASILLAIAIAIAGAAWLESSELTADVRLSLNVLAVIIWWIGSFVLCFGAKVSRLLIFPLLFLFWMVPIPVVALDRIVRVLQHGSATAAISLFNLAGVPVVQDGLQLSIPGLTLEVAKECSSIRSSLMLLVTTMVLAQLFLKSPLRKALVIAVAVPLSIAKNGLRIFTISMLGTRVDPGFLTGRLHHQGGIVFFMISLLIIFALLWALERSERRLARRPALKALAVP